MIFTCLSGPWRSQGFNCFEIYETSPFFRIRLDPHHADTQRWWFRNLVNSPVEGKVVEILMRITSFFLYIQPVVNWPWDFVLNQQQWAATSIWCFLKWWVSPTTPWVFLLKKISTWGVKWGYHPLRKHQYDVSKTSLCNFRSSQSEPKGLCIIGPRALELLNVVVINIWYGSPRVGAG